MSDKPGVYPAFDRRPMVRSGVVESGDIVWFRFRVKNTGNTILKPEGFGGWGLYPELCTRDAGGALKVYSHHYNLYIRDRKSLYPGETHDFWVNFTSAQSTDSYRLPPGDYSIMFRAYKGWNDWSNMWDGAWMYLAEMPITLADFDEFRTWTRIKNYRESLDLIRQEVPQAAMLLRTEGANAIVEGLDPSDPEPHIRQASYSQRRVGPSAA
jgi:hypothetical protein